MSLGELWAVVAVLAPLLVGAGLELGATDFAGARACFALAAIIFGAVTMYWIFKTKKTLVWRVTVGLAATAIVAVGLPVAFSWVASKEALAQADLTQPSTTFGDVLNNQGIVTQGQTGGTNTIIQGPPPRHLGDGDKQMLLARIPRDRSIAILAQNGDSDAANFADELKKFLEESGYTVKLNYGIIFNKRGGRGVNVDLNEDAPSEPVQINVGSR
jgi:hypothetical protein